MYRMFPHLQAFGGAISWDDTGGKCQCIVDGDFGCDWTLERFSGMAV
jgi:hypothetical protein